MKRETGQGIKPWELTDEIWEAAKGFIPKHRREEGKACKRACDGGRKPINPRRTLQGIFFALRTGIQRKALPKGYGSESSIRAYFSEWAQAGFFAAYGRKGF